MFDDENKDNSFEATQKTPLYQKAWEIMLIAKNISELAQTANLPNLSASEKQMLDSTAGLLLDNARIIPAKIAGALVVELYDIKMENASIIRKAARDILTNTSGLKMLSFDEQDYIELLRNTVEEFRILFAEWVQTFDPWNYSIDRWGLFNPPGVNYDDHDPDDDIPFNPDDYFE